MNIKLILVLFVMVGASSAGKKTGNGSKNRKSRYMLVKLKEESENRKAASESPLLPGKFYLIMENFNFNVSDHTHFIFQEEALNSFG